MLILLHGEVNSEMVTVVATALRKAKGKSVSIQLTSEGGDVYSALAVYSLLRSYPGEITIEGRGLIASAAVLIFAAGDKRLVSPEAHFMFHEGAIESSDSSTNVLRNESRQLEALDIQFNVLLTERTGSKYEIWEYLHKGVNYRNADSALDLNLATGLITEYRK